MTPTKQEADPWRYLLIQSAQDVQRSRDEAGLPTSELKLDPNLPEDNVGWTKDALEQLHIHFSDEEIVEVMNRCAHILPDERIAELKELYMHTGSVRTVHTFWKKRFESDLRKRYQNVPEDWLDTVIDKEWGEAGRIEGNVIIAAKVPQNLPGYFQAVSMEERRASYCHCGRIRSIFSRPGEVIPSSYCNCGGGFYRYNWERIVGAPVKVELRTTIMKGDDVCSFAIHLPVDIH